MARTLGEWTRSAFDENDPDAPVYIWAKNMQVCEILATPLFGEREDNAAFILRAVNAHDDLLEAAQQFLAVWDTDRDLTEEDTLALRRAVAKAKGEPWTEPRYVWQSDVNPDGSIVLNAIIPDPAFADEIEAETARVLAPFNFTFPEPTPGNKITITITEGGPRVFSTN
jgi:hypothetical protein